MATVLVFITQLQAGDILADSGKVVQSVNRFTTHTVVNFRGGYYGVSFPHPTVILIIK